MPPSTLTPDRSTFRALVADVAARAKARLPEAVNGRVESAARLVLLHDVQPQADGSMLVGSSSDPMKTYRLEGTTCTCQDFQHGKAPNGFCQHRIAAGIWKRVQELLPPATEPEATVAATVASRDGNAPNALPEAPCSVNCHVTIAGRQVQVTLRGTDEAEVLTRLEAVLARYPLPQPQVQPGPQLSPQQHNALAMHRPVSGFCAVHGVQMQENEKDGRRWYSHYDEAAGRWCKGK